MIWGKKYHSTKYNLSMPISHTSTPVINIQQSLQKANLATVPDSMRSVSLYEHLQCNCIILIVPFVWIKKFLDVQINKSRGRVKAYWTSCSPQFFARNAMENHLTHLIPRQCRSQSHQSKELAHHRHCVFQYLLTTSA